MTDNYDMQWYHKNYLDHVYAVSNDTGDILEHYRYSAFGIVEFHTPTGHQATTIQIANTVLWNSRRYDETTRLHYYKYRHYSPKLGRWLSRDPIGEKGGVNLYGLVGNNGVNDWDVLGQNEFEQPEPSEIIPPQEMELPVEDDVDQFPILPINPPCDLPLCIFPVPEHEGKREAICYGKSQESTPEFCVYSGKCVFISSLPAGLPSNLISIFLLTLADTYPSDAAFPNPGLPDPECCPKSAIWFE